MVRGGAAPCQIAEDHPLSNTRQVLRGSQADPAMSPICANMASPAHFPSGPGAPAPLPLDNRELPPNPSHCRCFPYSSGTHCGAGARARRARRAPSRGCAAQTPPGDAGLGTLVLFPQWRTPCRTWSGAGLGEAQPIAVPLAPVCPRRHKAQQLKSTEPLLLATQGHVCTGDAAQVPGGASEASRGGHSWQRQL